MLPNLTIWIDFNSFSLIFQKSYLSNLNLKEAEFIQITAWEKVDQVLPDMKSQVSEIAIVTWGSV